MGNSKSVITINVKNEPNTDLAGFVADKNYTLPFTLKNNKTTVKDLLELMNVYREKPITSIRLSPGGNPLVHTHNLDDKITVYIQ